MYTDGVCPALGRTAPVMVAAPSAYHVDRGVGQQGPRDDRQHEYALRTQFGLTAVEIQDGHPSTTIVDEGGGQHRVLAGRGGWRWRRNR